MGEMRRISVDEITEGAVYSAPVYFLDGTNMFLAANKKVKKYHMFAIKRWNIENLFTNGKKLSEDEIKKLFPEEGDVDFGVEVVDVSKPAAAPKTAPVTAAPKTAPVSPAKNVEQADDVEELEELEEI